jgi:hypothetical protein
MDRMKKQVARAFGKKIYLLGRDKDGYNVYLEAPSWDCGWYWSFGYIKRCTCGSSPGTTLDICSHTHWDSSIVGRLDGQSDYVHHVNGNNNFVSTVLNDRESWQLSELMSGYYILETAAEFFHHGGANITNISAISDRLVDHDLEDRINKVLLPVIFAEIDKLLSGC